MIIIHQRFSKKWDYTITGDDLNQNIISHSVQGYERRRDAIGAVYALQGALLPDALTADVDEWALTFTYMTHAQYTEWLRQHRNQQARNRRARKVKK